MAVPPPTLERTVLSAPESLGSPLALLAERAGEDPETPWLFEVVNGEWEWRSWGQVADQVARGAQAVVESPTLAGASRLACTGRPTADALAVVLAIQAAGRVAVLGRGRGGASALPRVRVAAGDPVASSGVDAASAESGSEVLLPAVRSRLDRWQPRPLDLARADGGGVAADAAAAVIRPPQLAAGAAELAASLPPIAGRPILCSTPAVSPLAVQRFAAWSLLSGAAWALVDDEESFLQSMLWVRPTVAVVPGEELELVDLALADRRRRRHSRLRDCWVVGEVPADLPRLRQLGIPCVAIDRDGLPIVAADC